MAQTQLMAQFIELKRGGAQTLSVRVNLGAQITKEKPGMYFSYCPALDLCSQGKTQKEAKDNLVEVVHLIIETHLERGTFAKWLKKLGFANPAKMARLAPRKKPAKSAPPNERFVDIPVAFPIAC